MISTLIEKELLERLNQRWLSMLFMSCILLGILCGLIQSWDLSERIRSASLLVGTSGEGGSQGPTVVFAPQALSLFAKGLDVQEGAEHIANPLSSLFQSLDFVRLVEVFLSLLAILTASVAISREWEQGTLRLVLSNSVPRTHVVSAKWISLLILFGLILAATLASFTATALVVGAIPLTNADWFRVLIVFGTSWLYLSVFLTAGLLISIWGVQSRRSTVFALLFWVVVLLVLPTFGALVGKALVNPPKRDTVLQAQGQVRMQLRLEASRGRISWPEYVKRATEEEQHIETDYQSRMNRYVQLSRRMMRLSPAASYVFAATAVAGTGLESWFRRPSVERVAGLPKGSLLRSAPSATQVLQDAAVDVATLAIMSLIFIALSYRAFMHADIHRA